MGFVTDSGMAGLTAQGWLWVGLTMPEVMGGSGGAEVMGIAMIES